MRRLALTLPLLALGCTTIQLEERHAFDNKRTIDLDAVRARGVRVDERRLPVGDGASLVLRHFRVPGSSGTVLHFGGNGFLMATAADAFDAMRAAGVDVVMFDYRGYGRSTGTPSVAALKADALEVYDWVTTTASVPPDRLLLHGHSLGSFVATYVAEQRPAAGILLESPVTNVDDLLEHLTPWLARLFVRFEVDPEIAAADNRARVSRLSIPVRFVVGEDDAVSPKEMAEDLYALAPEAIDKALVILPGRGHNDLPRDETYRRTYRTFARSLFGGEAP